MSHTPGPWRFRLEAVRTVIFHEGEIGERAIAVGAGFYPDHVGNARLISAAPCLAEALAEFVEEYCALVNSGDAGNWDPEKEPKVIKARAALAKAHHKGGGCE